MSDKIPFEIQMEIIQRIPDIKWVIQYRSVSKAWKSMIDSKEFVTGHTLRRLIRRPNHDHLLIRGQDFGDPQEVKYVSIVDKDDNQKFNLFVPDSVKILSKDARIFVGSSHGLFCLFDYEKNMVVIWNPTIRKTVLTDLPDDDELSELRWIDVGFGICPNTLDPKLVKINQDYVNNSTQVEVFTLGSRAWRSPFSNTFPRISIDFGRSQAVVDGFIYWDAYEEIIVDGLYRYDPLIMSFDLTIEEFTELYLPKPADGRVTRLFVSNLWESLGVFDFKNCYTDMQNINVWIMNRHGCTRSFEKLYDISPSDASIDMTLGFRRSGAPIVEMQNDDEDLPGTLAVYDPESKDITEICSDGIKGAFRVHSYMETLLLLDH